MYGIRTDFVIGMNWIWVLMSPVVMVTWTSHCPSFLICKAGIIMLFTRSVLKIKWDDVCVNWGLQWGCHLTQSTVLWMVAPELYSETVWFLSPLIFWDLPQLFKVNESNLSYYPLTEARPIPFLNFQEFFWEWGYGTLYLPWLLLVFNSGFR